MWMKVVIAPPRVPSPSKNQRDFLFADMAKLADALDLGSSAARCEGSSPSARIAKNSCGGSVVVTHHLAKVGHAGPIPVRRFFLA